MEHIPLTKKKRAIAGVAVVILGIILASVGNRTVSLERSAEDLYRLFEEIAAEQSAPDGEEDVDTKDVAGVVVPSIPEDRWFILRVVDGDTVIAVDGTKKEFRVRLLGVDTPESVHPSQPVECFGVEASRHLTSLLQHQMVRFEFDASQGMFDKYDRTLSYLYLEDGTFINERLIRNGYAHEYTYTPDTPYAHQALFDEAERDAREHARGLWALGVCTA